MATYRTKLDWWDTYRCNPTDLVSVTVLGRYPVKVQKPLQNATYALDAVLRATGYRNPTGPTGSYLCRKISGTDLWSLHAYGIAIDLDYSKNPHLHTPIARGFDIDPRFMITEHQVTAIESITNTNNDPIWKWLGWSIGDTMHFEADQPPHLCEPKGTPMYYRGVINVPDADWARKVINWAIDNKIIITGDTFTDDWNREHMTDGRLWTFLKRYDDTLRNP